MSGILSFLYIPFGYVLKLCGILSGNHYVLSLLFFALIMQIILFPLGIKQQKSSVKMAKINPKVQLVREKYKGRNDRPTQQKMNMEIQDLYTKEGYSQLAGCLPLLIQLPIILALFGVIRQPLTYSVALANDEFNVDNQYKTAIIMLEEGKSAIEKSGILSQKYNDDQKDEKIKQTDLTKLKKDFVMLQKYFGATLDDKDVWNKEAALTDMRSNYEMDLTSFMIKDGKKVYNDLLQNLGVTEKITTDFETKDMDEMPSFTFFGNFSFLDTPKSYIGFNVLMIIPILVFLSSFYSGILTKKFTIAQGAPEANMPGNGALMKWGMPAMSAYFSITFPAAIGVYWIYRTVLATVQQYILSKMYPMPKISEAEIEEARRQLKSKKKKIITIEVDEDDNRYDDLAIKKSVVSENSSEPKNKSKIPMLTGEETDTIESDNTNKIEKAPLKEDKPQPKSKPNDKN